MTALTNKIGFVDLIVLASYYIFSLFLALSLAGLFRKEYIIIGLAVGLLLLIFFRKKIEFSKSFLFFLILVPFLFSGILLLKGCFGGDGIDYWLPWAREISLQGKMPDFILECRGWLTSRMPLMSLFYGGLFSVFGSGSLVIAFLPFFFSACTVYLVYRWLSEKGVSKEMLFLGVLFLLANPLFLERGGEIAQEPFIFFFFTAFFYYLEKSQRTRSIYCFFLATLSFLLAAVSKETGLILFLPWLWFLIKNRRVPKIQWLCFLIWPLIVWLLRNYAIYGNPLFPYLNEIFRGPYYGFVAEVGRVLEKFDAPFWNNISGRIIEVPVNLFLSFCPAIVLSFYGFFKEKRIQYVALFFILLLTMLFMIGNRDYFRYVSPFLGVFIVYAAVGLAEIKSKLFLSTVVFFSLWGLFTAEFIISQSQLFSPLEKMLSGPGIVAAFISQHNLFFALALAIFFLIFISPHRISAKYLAGLVTAACLVRTATFNLGSWLNIWLPILCTILIVLGWRFAVNLNEKVAIKLTAGYIIALLLLSGWGLPLAYFLGHKDFMFPNTTEAYGTQPEAALEIEKREGENRDFYIFASAASYFTWYHNLKVVVWNDYAFQIITDLKYQEDLDASEIHALFQKSNIKYIINNHLNRPQLESFFSKIESRPDLFEPIFTKKGAYTWQVK